MTPPGTRRTTPSSEIARTWSTSGRGTSGRGWPPRALRASRRGTPRAHAACRGRDRWSARRASAGSAWSPAPSRAGAGDAHRPTASAPVRTERSSRTRTVRATRGPPSRVRAADRRRARARSRRVRAVDVCWSAYPTTTVVPRLTRARRRLARPATMSSSVDFPEPFGPTTPSARPGSINRSTSWNTTSSPYACDTPRSSTTWLPSRVVPARARGRAANTCGLGATGDDLVALTAAGPSAWSTGPAHRAQPLELACGRGSCESTPRSPPARAVRPGPRGTPRTRSSRRRPGGRSPARSISTTLPRPTRGRQPVECSGGRG